ncbi:MAG: hypothetical protein ACP5FL_08265, partial [Thermoplasmatota archaeon]
IETALRSTAYRDGQILERITNHHITIDNMKPAISIIEAEDGKKIRDAAVLSYNTSDNTASVEVQYSPDNQTWTTAGIDYSSSNFAFDATNLSGTVWIRATAVTRTGHTASTSTSFEIAEDAGLGTFGRLSFIINSLEVGWTFLKRISAVGEPEGVPGNLYKSFFDARGTDSYFAFFVFVPLVILSLFAPFVYLTRKKRFGMLDGLMLAYIIFHLFIYVNVSTSQGGGYDVRWYLPLYLPFLYFAVVAVKNILKDTFSNVLRTYLASLVVLLPVFVWAMWITSLNRPRYMVVNGYHFSRIAGVFGDAMLVSIVLVFTLYLLNKKGWLTCKDKGRMTLEKIVSSFIGVSIFPGTLLLFVTMVLRSRGLPEAITVSGRDFTTVIPIIRAVQDFLLGLLT